MTGPYVNEDGEIWIERGSVSWPAARHAAADMARWLGDDRSVAIYEGIERHVRVSDEREEPHMEAADCAGCCRTIDAYSFRTVER
jgi:hypothetical protein